HAEALTEPQTGAQTADGTEAPACDQPEAGSEAPAGAEPETQAAHPEQLTQMTSLKAGDIDKGTVVKVEDNQAFVDVGYKYEDIIPIREVSALHIDTVSSVLSVGDDVEVKVLSIHDDKERLILSKRAVDSENAWKTLKEKFEKQEI